MIHSLHFAVGEEVVLEERLKALHDLGYVREHTASQPAQFTHRGGVLDVFPWGFSFPVRIEFMDNVVESIFSFDPASGSLLEPHKMVVILATTEKQAAQRWKKFEWTWGERPIQPFVDIDPGDLVVHVSHGIGKFRGVQKLSIQGAKPKPHLIIEYQDAEKLYVPLDDLNLVQRFVAPGVSASKIKLSKLGSKTWVKIREKAREGIVSYAHELLEMQARREILTGFTFGKRTEWEEQLEQSFPYEETPDQEKAIREVIADMENTKPMDRLICGDVGYGKTEVALRAIFRAVTNGKQAAFLVPTTLLAEQHFETFSERFKPFPIRVEMLSRFQTASEQERIVKAAASGEADLVIGTHRLLSEDMSFKNLGLVVIDEEQKFGVRHKDRLKKFRLMVDVLTLTATPIPRTLYLSLVGGKDMSVVNTPPKNRVPIKARVLPYDEGLIQKAIRLEVERKGQVFFVHNRVDGIELVAKKISELVPEARLAVAHGQMPSKALESIMHQFIHGEVDVLVSTTIIESGIDIANANTLIVNRADAFGLAELYQLKGRVGRYNREAYAYFLIPKGHVTTPDSDKRLNAIERHSYLGSGFSIAMEDLEIRGAGNLLGTEQSGFVMSVGFDLYCRLLKDAIDTLTPKKTS